MLVTRKFARETCSMHESERLAESRCVTSVSRLGDEDDSSSAGMLDMEEAIWLSYTLTVISPSDDPMHRYY